MHGEEAYAGVGGMRLATYDEGGREEEAPEPVTAMAPAPAE